MSRVDEIEAAIDGLPPAEYRLIVDRLREREEKRWDLQLDSDDAKLTWTCTGNRPGRVRKLESEGKAPIEVLPKPVIAKAS